MTKERRHPNVINHDELDPKEVKQGKHHYVTRRLGIPAGAQQLGATLTEIPPGKISYPLHFHCANEEAVYVISGKGTARIGDTRVPVRAGDWISYPVGPAHAHQMINDSDAPLVYLALSTGHKCEVVGYPDSKKIGSAATPAGGTFQTNPWIFQLSRQGETLDYWDGEPDAK